MDDCQVTASCSSRRRLGFYYVTVGDARGVNLKVMSLALKLQRHRCRTALRWLWCVLPGSCRVSFPLGNADLDFQFILDMDLDPCVQKAMQGFIIESSTSPL